MVHSHSRKRMKQLILNQAIESLENSYPEGGLTEEVLQDTLQQVIEDLYDYGELDEADYHYFVRNVPKLSQELASELAESDSEEADYFDNDEEE